MTSRVAGLAVAVTCLAATTTLAEPVAVRGLVLGGDGRPLAGAVVQARAGAPQETSPAGPPAPSNAAPAVITDAAGVFVLPLPESGFWVVTASASGYRAQEIALAPVVEEVELPAAVLEAGEVSPAAAAPPAPEPRRVPVLAGERVEPHLGATGRALPGPRWRAAAPDEASPGESAADAAAPAGAPPRVVAGRVLDEKGRKPLAGALVWAPEAPAVFARTAADGGYRLPVPAAARRLRADAAGHLPAQIDLPAGADAEAGVPGPTLLLEPTRTFTDTVTDEAGEPIAGADVVARVRLYGSDDGPGPLYPELRGRSGEDGRFALRGVGFVAYDVAVVHPDFAPLRAEVPAAFPAPDFELGAGATLSGRVTGGGGEPLAGARIEARWAKVFGAGAAVETARAVSDASGR